MGDLAAKFSRWEFKCGCGQDTVDCKLMDVLVDLHEYLSKIQRAETGQPVLINITSGNRCVEYNEEVQKRSNPFYVPYSSKSQHLIGRAADFQVGATHVGLHEAHTGGGGWRG